MPINYLQTENKPKAYKKGPINWVLTIPFDALSVDEEHLSEK